ncbi:MAG: LUD domain-containing protein, partial [Thermodesulfobacteriota bacterium]
RKDIISGVLPGEYQEAMENVRSRKEDERQTLIDILKRRAQSLNIDVRIMPDPASVIHALRELVINREPEWGDRKGVVAWKHPLVEAMDLKNALASVHSPVRIAEEKCTDEDRILFRKDAGEALLGVTSAEYCVAESATLVIRSRPGHPRSASLLPTLHAAIIRANRILKNTRELYALFHADKSELGNSTMLITGPSKTADIEATLVHGAHGPRELHLFILSDEPRSEERS